MSRRRPEITHYLALAESLDCELWTANERFYPLPGGRSTLAGESTEGKAADRVVAEQLVRKEDSLLILNQVTVDAVHTK